jgi:hypothetical protein
MSASCSLFISDVEVVRWKEFIRCSITRQGPSSYGKVALSKWGALVYVGYSQPREGVIEISSKHVGSVAEYQPLCQIQLQF